MKKILLVLIMALVVSLLGCVSKNNSIELKEKGKEEYYVGERFSCEGYTLLVTIDGKTKKVNLDETMVNVDKFQSEGEKKIYVEYKENGVILKTTIIVMVKPLEKITLESISVKEKGKIEYLVGEKFDVNGYVIECIYSDKSKEEKTVTLDMIDYVDEFKETGEKIITISYTSEDVTKTAQVKINVKAIEPVKIEVKQVGKDYYTYEYELDLTDYIFTVTYSDGTTKDVKLEKGNCTPTSFEENITDEPIETVITGTYVEDDKTLTVTFTVNVYSEWGYEEYVGMLESLELSEKIYQDLCDIIPTEATEKINLPSSKDYGYKFTLLYSSSNADVLSPTGNVTRFDDDKVVTITLTIKNEYLEKTYTWDVLIKGLGPVILRPWDNSKKHIFGYFYEGTSHLMSEDDARRIDVINYCFARVRNGICDISELKYLNENIKLRRSTGVRMVLSIGGGGKDTYGFSDACLTQESRKVFIDSMMEILKKYNLDGFDIDWEYPSWEGLGDSKPVDKANFTLLLKELREALDNYKEGLLLTAALIGGVNVDRFYEVSEINKYLDFAHIMTYDLNNSGVASHHSNPFKGNRAYSAKSAMDTYHDGGMDYNKIVIGAAFYGKISKLKTPTTPEQALNKATESATTIHYTAIVEMMKDSKYVKVFDQSTGAYYLSDGEYFITYDDSQAIITKCRMTEQYNLGGIMFWDYGSDATGTLLRTMSAEILMINNGR